MEKTFYKEFDKPNPQKGQAAIVFIIVILAVSLVVISGIGSLMHTHQRTIVSVTKSMESYYTAEAGIQDSLLRVIDPDLDYKTPNSLGLNGAETTITITSSDDQVTMSSRGDKDNNIREIALSVVTSPTGVGFHYGIQTGVGGLYMVNSSKVTGNLYSNGDVIGENTATITGDVWVAGTSTLKGFTVGGNAHANHIENSQIGKDAYYQTIYNTTVSGTSYPGSPDPEPREMPISQSQIDEWKNEAALGGEISDYTLSGSGSLGPKKINGNMTLRTSAVLTMTGIIWVTGDVSLGNSSVIQLASSFGDLSSILIADGTINITNSIKICGSEGYNSGTKTCNPPGESYVLIISTNNSLNPASPAISMENSSNLRGVLYAGSGMIRITNRAHLKEATAYTIRAENNSEIIYETGLIDMSFTSGPTGGWEITSWGEVE